MYLPVAIAAIHSASEVAASRRAPRAHARTTAAVDDRLHAPQHPDRDNHDGELGHEDRRRAFGGGICHEQRDAGDGIDPEPGPHDREESFEWFERDARRAAKQSQIEHGARSDQDAEPHGVQRQHCGIRPNRSRFPQPGSKAACLERRQQFHHASESCKWTAIARPDNSFEKSSDLPT